MATLIKKPTVRSLFRSTLLLLALSGAFPAVPSQAAEKEIKIGLAATLTGGDAEEGAIVVKMAELAAKQINAEGGVKGAKIRIVVEDTQSTAEGTLPAVQQLVEKHKVLAIIGPVKSFQIVGMAPSVRKYGIPVLIGGTSPRLTEDGNPWIFRCRPDDTLSAFAMVQYIKENTAFKRIGILHELDVFGNGGANLVERYAKEAGLQVVKRAGFEKGATDFSEPLNSINAAGADALLVYSTQRTAGAVHRAFKKIGKQSIYLGSPSSANEASIADAQDAAEGHFAVVDTLLHSEAGKKLVDAYKKEYQSYPNAVDVYAYDSVKIIADAIKSVGESPDKMRTHILGLRKYAGAMGNFNFTPNGNGLHEVSIVKIQGKQPHFVRTISQKHP